MTDHLGNTIAREGLDRCHCGSKYWENDRCIDCGTHVSRIDSTEDIRRVLIPEMPHLAQQELDAGRPVYTTAEMQAEFAVTGFLAPFVTVTRKADGQKGTLVFTGSPRYYFAFVPE